mmetsp:Transcript_6872/g.8933  ORF Transcript_6872/g.8933 Transcript_6872/m.8933 type:complete len:154 (+) Transcript_6872:3-464(+)
MMKEVLQVFPDAKFIVTHRDPVAFSKSAISLLAYAGGTENENLNLSKLAEFWLGQIANLLTRMKTHLEDIPSNQVIHVKFDDFVRDNINIVRSILVKNHLELDDATLDAVNDYLDANPRDGAMKFQYSLEAFNLTADNVREQFQFYSDLNLFS